MYKPLLLICTCLLLQLFVFANDYDKAWEALQKNDRKQASEYLQKAIKNPETATDAYITSILLKEFEGVDETSEQFHEMVLGKVKDANPYLFALWFKNAVVGQYGKKTNKGHLELLEQIWNRNDINGSLKSASKYVMAMHFLGLGQFEKAKAEWAKMGSLSNWQLVGPFDNLSGSGFYKSYGPLEHPEETAVFKSVTKASIQWFTPLNISKEGWVFLNSHIPENTAITYAQTFVYVPQDMEIVVNAGVNGSLKVWVNDGLIIAENKERVTELDCYKSYAQLKKGYNRVLVQIGVTNNSIANFIIRCTDKDGNPIQGLTNKSEAQPYVKQADNSPVNYIRHFAEVYFEDKIKAQPDNPLNYILLSQVLLRNQKTFEARKIIQMALEKYPTNSLLRFELIQCLIKEGSRTLLSQEIERIKETDPDCYFVYKLNLDQLMDEEKYDEASELYNKMIAIRPEDQYDIQDHVRILIAKDKTDEAIKIIQGAYKKYPGNYSIVTMMFNIEKGVYKNREKATKIYEEYLKDNFNIQLYKNLSKEYIDQGKKEAGLKMLKDIQQLFPYDASLSSDIVSYYFQQQDYKKALEYCDLALKLSPYVATYWENKATVQEQAGDEVNAVVNYKKALYFDSKRYETRRKIRSIEKQMDLYKVFPETDVYEVIRKAKTDPVSQDHDYSFLIDEKLAIVYAEGAVEEYMTMVIKIHNEKGIDHWKDSYIPYNEYSQNLLIEKAEIVKKNGNKVTAEKNGNEMVFTSLEVGDAVFIKYRLQNYASGRLGKEFWDRYTFASFNPSGVIRYSILINKDVAHEFKMANSTLAPQVKSVGDFKLYTWEVINPAPVEDEPYMPTLTDIGSTLHISTIKSWDEVAKWYSDISYMKTEGEYELKDAYDEIFATTDKLSDIQKAKKIYSYIQSNIRYSSVSFRQSAYVPQKPSVTINTRLGDCKDLSSLFVSLADMAGIKANLVLVDTRDNGTKEMLLPSVEFNHCIVLLKAGGKEYYLEMTDNNLPFGSMPKDLPGAASLIIPRQGDNSIIKGLQLLPELNRNQDKIKRKVSLGIDDADLTVKCEIVKTGALTSSLREDYRNLSDEKMKEYMEESLSSGYNNPIKVESVSFSNLEEMSDSLHYKYNFRIKNEVVEVGDMKMFKIPFGDVIATIDNFSKDVREFPLEYWRYEDVDQYETVVRIDLPAGKKFIDIPKAEVLNFGKSSYSIQYKLTGTSTLTVTRKASLVRDDILPQEYKAFKEFMNKIVKTEAKYIAYK